MNPESLQYLWSLVMTVACLVAAAADVMTPTFDKMSGGDVDSMVVLYDEVVRINPANVSVHLHRGLARLSQKEFDKAVEDFDAMIRIAPDCTIAYLLRGNTWQQLKRPDLAIRDFDEALKNTPDLMIAYLMRGVSQISQHSAAAAIADLDDALRIDPDKAVAYAARAQAWAMKGQMERARRDVDRAIQLEPNQTEYYSLSASIWNTRGDFDRAIVDYDRALKFDGRHAEARWQRACAWYAQKEYSRALVDVLTLDGIDPRSLPLKSIDEVAHQALTAADLSIGKRSEIEIDDTALAAAYCDRGIAYFALERWDHAVEALTEAIRLDPSLATALYFRAQTWLRLDQPEHAINDLTLTLQIDPQDANSWYCRGTAKFALHDWDGACEDFTEALRIDPQLIRARARRGIARHESGDDDHALEDLEQVAAMPTQYVRDVQKSRMAATQATSTSTLQTISDWSKSPASFQAALGTALGSALGNQPNGNAGTAGNANQVTIKIEITKNANSQPGNNAAGNPAAPQFYEVCLDPVYLDALRTRAFCRERRGEWSRAVDAYHHVIRLIPKDSQAYRRLAWLRATCPDDDGRSGEEAVRYAQSAVTLVHGADEENLVTLAAAYAELGDWHQAIHWQTRARELLGEDCDKQFQVRRERLEGLDFERSLDAAETDSTDGALPTTIQRSLAECHQSGWRNVNAIEKLADAYADAGQLEQALQYQRKATELIHSQRDQPHVERLNQYRQQQPVRDESLIYQQ